MTKKVNPLVDVIKRNFSENDVIYVGINKKFYNEKHPENQFNRDFEEVKYKLPMFLKMIPDLMNKYDLYMCFTNVGDVARIKQNALPTFLIAQDIDGVPVPTDLEPSYYWETSPGKYQGLWILDNKVSPKKHEELCRKLINKYGFDKTGADIVHYYRIPGTYNNKYASQFKVGKMLGTGKVYRLKEFEKALAGVETGVMVEVSDETIKYEEQDYDEVMQRLNLYSVFKHTSTLDRSEWSWKLEQRAIENGATKEEVKWLLLNAPDEVAKFDINTVDAEVNRAFAKAEQAKKLTEHKKASEILNIKVKGSVPLGDNEVKIVKVSDIEPFDPTDFWLIEDLWENESVGIIGAPSKSFKSTLTINLACAVASGTPFDGREVKQGAVLIVQGENNLSMEQHKIYSITGRTDLPIYFVESNMTLDTIGKLKKVIMENKIRLLIIDPLYLLFGAGDINSHRDITDRLQRLTQLRNDTGCSIMLVHHSRKLERGAKITTQDMYGSAFIEGWYESMLLLQRNGMNTSRLTTYFRNHRSGDKYTILVDDSMACKMIKDSGKDEEDEWKKPQMSFDQIKESKKEVDEFAQETDGEYDL